MRSRRPDDYRRRRPKPAGGPPTDWNSVARWYDQLVGETGSEYQQHVVHPGVVRLLQLNPGQRILDVACGQGVLCRLLHSLGAQVAGVDAAPDLIKLARERSDPAIGYHLGDARDLSHLPARHYQAATCVLAIQNINPLAPVFESIANRLQDNGLLVIVMMHPCFRSPKHSHWGWDEQVRVQYRRIDRYLLPRKEPIVTHPGKDPTGYTWSFHRPIQSYVKALAQQGLLIDSLEEWPSHKHSDSGPRASAENASRKEIPLFLALRARKVRGMETPPGPDREPR